VFTVSKCLHSWIVVEEVISVLFLLDDTKGVGWVWYDCG